MNTQSILVADGDPKNLQILKENLEASGFQVIIVADGTKAWEEIQKNDPDLILTEINLPGLSGFQLLEKLRADPNTSSIPVIFLTNQREVQQRVRAFQMGAKDYLTKPLHVKEVIAHIRMIQRRLERKKADQIDYYNKISGRLDELNLSNLIESLSVERKTGVLTLNNDNNKTGQIYFREGAIINATLGDIRLENAIYQMLPWKKGSFDIVFKEVDVPDEISVSNLGLLLEGTKKMERREKIINKFPSPKTAFTITPTFQKILKKKSLPEDVKHFISLLDGKKNIAKIIDESCYDDLKTLERLLRLYQQGFIKPTIAAKVVRHGPETTEKIEEKRKTIEESTKPEKPLKITQEPAVTTSIPDDIKPIKQRIEKQRTEIILPEEPKSEDLQKITPQQVPDKPEEILQEDTKESSVSPKIEKPYKETAAPTFSREEFIRKQVYVKTKMKEETPVDKHITEEKPATQVQPQSHKNQILTIGLDEDSLDEVLDILTDNSFQTKKFEVLGDLTVHFGKIAINEFNFITLLGIFIDKSIAKLIEALLPRLYGIIFVIDCTKDDLWEYTNYLIHSIWNAHHLPYAVAVTNFHEQNSVTMEVIRCKLNLDKQAVIIAWDEVDKSLIRKLLASVVSSQQKETEAPRKNLEEIVEKVTV